MKIERLKFLAYRNLEDGVFEPDGGINVVYGRNAQGKTNLLEAMWLFTGGRSFRGARDAELIRFGADEARLELDFFSEGRDQNAVLTIKNGRRAAVLNGVEQRSAAGLVGRFRAVIFSPEHLSLVKGGPALRRDFLDGALCQLKPAYARLLSQYQHTLTQRNALLKDIPRHSELLDTLDIWDERLARFGGEIVRERKAYLEKLESPARDVYAGISQNREVFSAAYRSCVTEGRDDDAPFSGRLLECLRAARRDDLAAGFTTAGPHRDDLEIFVDGVPSRAYASQGQQRSAVLALKLAEAQVLSQKTEEEPVVFLDDVLSELDAGRQSYLLNHLERKQVFITCCDPETANRFGGAGKFKMEAGKLSLQAHHGSAL